MARLVKVKSVPFLDIANLVGVMLLPLPRNIMKALQRLPINKSINQSISLLVSCVGRGCPQYPSQGLMYKTHDKDNDEIREKTIVKYQSN